ncbi:histidinol-phosphatase [Paenibacillus alba]|uniref:Histidinol-phosphatase n=1 Tax=Paenibacillus alba TaxID=1197127 RepID=A0ABU6GFY2_9BACL|nr:histidinol-phosphatase [Paenibacillus alba]MEC0232107.1 histidinol-phosphatase [Paenibacillus alba]NQX68978.1 histidinol-phosphatase [Paenibacillus alba]
MKFDLHTHHDRCGHAQDTIREYIEAAISAGLQVIGISDHSPYFGSPEDHAQPLIAMAKSEFPRYVAEVLQFKKEYEGKIDVLLGVESDYFPEHTSIYQQEYAKYPFDYIIGSVHLSGGVSIFNRNRWKSLNEEQKITQKEEYYRLIAESARSGMFNILGHIDAMKGFYPAFSDIVTPKVNETLKIIGESGVAIEINTSGKTKDVGGWYPSHEILEQALHHGVEVTFGSDAHIPSRVADDWDEVRQTLKEIGFKHWVYFKNKQKQIVQL